MSLPRTASEIFTQHGVEVKAIKYVLRVKSDNQTYSSKLNSEQAGILTFQCNVADICNFQMLEDYLIHNV